MSAEFVGGCACGAVRYRLTSRPMIVHCCHCLDCQRQTGSAFVLNAMIESERVVAEKGATEPVGVPTDSGRPHDIHRCPTCHIALWSHYGGRPKIAFVRVGSLDAPSALEPDVHIYTRTKMPWIVLPNDKPAFAAYYDAAQIWPSASLERREAVFGGRP